MSLTSSKNAPFSQRMAVVTVGLLMLGGCSSNTSPSPTPGGSGGGSAAPAVVVAIVGSSGSQAYSPNPVPLAGNQTFGFRNNDSTAHRIVADNGSFDSGTLNSGASSGSFMISGTSAVSFHCTIHPSMVGTLNP